MIDKDSNPPEDIPDDIPEDIVDATFNLIRNQMVPDGPSEEVFAQTLEALRGADDRDLAGNSRFIGTGFIGARFFGARFINSKTLTRMAAGLLLAIGAAALIFTMLRSPAISFAEVVKKIAEAQSLSVDLDGVIPGKTTLHSKMLMSDQGISMDFPNGSRMVMKAPTMLVLNAETKTAVTMDMKNNPAKTELINILECFRLLLDKPAKDLGDDQIDGRRARKFLAETGGMEFTIWADAQSGDVLRAETVVHMDGTTVTETFSNFVLNPVIPAGAFSTDIPSDYNIDQRQVELPDILNGEQNLVDALRGYADRAGGKFPDSLGDLSEVLKVFKFRFLQPNIQAAPPPLPKEVELKWAVQFGAVRPFLASLGKDGWAYLGKDKGIADKDALIFWYKSRTGYRGVYGDFSVKDLPAQPQ